MPFDPRWIDGKLEVLTIKHFPEHLMQGKFCPVCQSQHTTYSMFTPEEGSEWWGWFCHECGLWGIPFEAWED